MFWENRVVIWRTLRTRTHGERGYLTEFICDRHPASCYWISTVKSIVNSDKWIKMVNFKCGNEMWKVSWSIWHECGTKKKYMSTWQEWTHNLPNIGRSWFHGFEHLPNSWSPSLFGDRLWELLIISILVNNHWLGS